MYSVMWSEHCSYQVQQGSSALSSGQDPADRCAAGRDRGERRSGRHRRRLGGHVQSREPQPPQLHRAVSGRSHRRRGIVRDILSMGARPLAVMDQLRFGDVASRHRAGGARWSPGSVATATVWGFRTSAEKRCSTPCYQTNPLVNALCVGRCVTRHPRLQCSRCRQPRGALRCADGRRWHRRCVRTGQPRVSSSPVPVSVPRQVGDPFMEEVADRVHAGTSARRA